MRYTVTTGGTDESGRPAPLAVHQPDFGTPDEALDYVRHLVMKGERYISIQDGNGDSVCGDDLGACLRGEKQLSADLKLV
jgi:hypothetical protein